MEHICANYLLLTSIHKLMKAILISIKPKYAAQIYAGTKHFELRKRTPNIMPGSTLLIYESYPTMRVTGLVKYRGCQTAHPWTIWYHFKDFLGIDYKSYMDYYKTDLYAHAWELYYPRRWEAAPQLADLGLSRPPQSYQFIELPDQVINSL